MRNIQKRTAFGVELQKYRVSAKMTMTEMAQLLGVRYDYLSKIENEKSMPTFKMFVRILDALRPPQEVRQRLLAAAIKTVRDELAAIRERVPREV